MATPIGSKKAFELTQGLLRDLTQATMRYPTGNRPDYLAVYATLKDALRSYSGAQRGAQVLLDGCLVRGAHLVAEAIVRDQDVFDRDRWIASRKFDLAVRKMARRFAGHPLDDVVRAVNAGFRTQLEDRNGIDHLACPVMKAGYSNENTLRSAIEMLIRTDPELRVLRDCRIAIRRIEPSARRPHIRPESGRVGHRA